MPAAMESAVPASPKCSVTFIERDPRSSTRLWQRSLRDQDLTARPNQHDRDVVFWDAASDPLTEEELLDELESDTASTADNGLTATSRATDEEEWFPLASCAAHFPFRSWWIVMQDLVKFPERNSTYILRADILEEERIAKPSPLASSGSPADARAYILERVIRRHILPRNPHIDSSLHQECTFFRRKRRPRQAASDPSKDYANLHQQLEDGLVIYRPYWPGQTEATEDDLPWYHPKVKSLAYRFIASPVDDSGRTGHLEVHVQLFGSNCASSTRASLLPVGSASILPTSHRLLRTAKSLLETQHKISYGISHNYVKRVHHDVVVSRVAFQDTYVRLKGQYASELIQGWMEATDPSKHVFEDLGIAAFLIELWRDTYPDAKPPGGFVDVGCGNGLLVHILRREGYQGYGMDLRARKSWSMYSMEKEGVQDLRVVSLDAPSVVVNAATPSFFPTNSFLIGNHADELTPWIPLMASVTPGEHVGFINIPCCPFTLQGVKFDATKFVIDQDIVRPFLPDSHDREQLAEEQARLIKLVPNHQPGSSTAGNASKHGGLSPLRKLASQAGSRNQAYLLFVGLLHLQAGWLVEKEALRIPSTKNWCLIGRRRVSAAGGPPKGDQQATFQTQVRERVAQMAQSAAPSWTARIPEGNAGKA